MMEIYNEQVKDLLCSADGNNENSAKLEIRLNPDGEVFVQGLTKHKIQSIQEVLDLFHHGSTSRMACDWVKIPCSMFQRLGRWFFWYTHGLWGHMGRQLRHDVENYDIGIENKDLWTKL